MLANNEFSLSLLFSIAEARSDHIHIIIIFAGENKTVSLIQVNYQNNYIWMEIFHYWSCSLNQLLAMMAAPLHEDEFSWI